MTLAGIYKREGTAEERQDTRLSPITQSALDLQLDSNAFDGVENDAATATKNAMQRK